MDEHETQQTVWAWIDAAYPGASVKRRVLHLFEEVTELGVNSNPDIPLDAIIGVVTHAWNKAQAQKNDTASLGGEVADTRIALTGLASALGVDEQQVLDEKMTAIRAKGMDEMRAREAQKQQLPIFRKA